MPYSPPSGSPLPKIRSTFSRSSVRRVRFRRTLPRGFRDRFFRSSSIRSARSWPSCRFSAHCDAVTWGSPPRTRRFRASFLPLGSMPPSTCRFRTGVMASCSSISYSRTCSLRGRSITKPQTVARSARLRKHPRFRKPFDFKPTHFIRFGFFNPDSDGRFESAFEHFGPFDEYRRARDFENLFGTDIHERVVVA